MKILCVLIIAAAIPADIDGANWRRMPALLSRLGGRLTSAKAGQSSASKASVKGTSSSDIASQEKEKDILKKAFLKGKPESQGLSFEEFKNFLQSASGPLGMETGGANDVFKELAKGASVVTFDAYYKWLRKTAPTDEKKKTADLQEAFNMIANKNTKLIGERELKNLYSNLGMSYDIEEIRNALKEYGTNNNVDFEGFKRLMEGKSSRK